MLFISCAPKSFLLERPKLLSVYFDRKIDHLEKSKNHNVDHHRVNNQIPQIHFDYVVQEPWQ